MSDLCKESNYCKTITLNACALFPLLWANLENISQILIFADRDLPRNPTKIGRHENFPFYGIKPKPTRPKILNPTLQPYPTIPYPRGDIFYIHRLGYFYFLFFFFLGGGGGVQSRFWGLAIVAVESRSTPSPGSLPYPFLTLEFEYYFG